jgi:uncharacterized membrane protein SirB2
MLESYVALLGAHMLLAVSSPLLFSLRAWRSIRGLEPTRGWLRVTPHVVDSLLLLAGIGLALIIRQYRVPRRVAYRKTALIGLALVLYLFAVAITRSPTAGLA